MILLFKVVVKPYLIISGIYIAPYWARYSCSKAFYSVIIPDSGLFQSNTHTHTHTHLTSKGAYNAYGHYRRKTLLEHIAIASCQLLIFMDESIRRHMTTLDWRPFGHVFCALTNWPSRHYLLIHIAMPWPKQIIKEQKKRLPNKINSTNNKV